MVGSENKKALRGNEGHRKYTYRDYNTAWCYGSTIFEGGK